MVQSHFPDARKNAILEVAGRGEELHVATLASRLNVSTQTIRRDLAELEKAGLIRRVYGGAVPAAIGRPEPVNQRIALNPTAKRAIAQLAAALIKPNHRIFIGPGSTTVALAECLSAAPTCHVTTSMAPALALSAAAGHEVECTGGAYNAEYQTFTGPGTLRAVEERMFDIAFFSVYGFVPDLGLVEAGEFATHLQRKVRARSRAFVALVTHEKFGKTSNFIGIGAPELDFLVTDQAPDEATCDALEGNGVRILWPNG